MTGYGIAKQFFRDAQLQVEIKSVNSRGADIRIRSPFDLKDKEFTIRKEVIESAVRGKIDVVMELTTDNLRLSGLINEKLFRDYLQVLKPIADEFELDGSHLLSSVLRIPEVVAGGSDHLNETEWQIVESTLDEAMDRFLQYRQEEGSAIERDFINCITRIEDCLERIAPHEGNRMNKVRERINSGLEEFIPVESIDANRFEQELIYYLEKIDFSEEKSRLSQHCKYFRENLDTDVMSKGRTLNFIAQEIGREINTMGSKAYDSEIQRIVVEMKDELEKIKEQTANIV